MQVYDGMRTIIVNTDVANTEVGEWVKLPVLTVYRMMQSVVIARIEDSTECATIPIAC